MGDTARYTAAAAIDLGGWGASGTLMLAGLALTGVLVAPATVSAQQSQSPVSQAVVQAVPPRQAADLSTALRQLARNPRNLEALIDAGNASLALDDVDAAIGFFGRADDLSPNNPRVKTGLAGAFVRSAQPLDALRLFTEAESVGGTAAMLAPDRGLAYDLVGDPVRAQQEYQRALAFDRSDETVRRLALSQAIAGDRQRFEVTLRPLIERRDFAAYRIRAFGLAILGADDEAVAITGAVMPSELAARIEPYLRYMPQLTRAQQAAAANLGIFPRAAQIGRDNPQFAQYRANSNSASARTAGSRLAPSGPALGERAAASPPPDTRSQRRRPGSRASSSVSTPERSAAEIAQARADRRAASDPLQRSQARRRATPPPPPPPPPPPVPVAAQPVPVAAQQVEVAPATPTDSVARPSVSVARADQAPTSVAPSGSSAGGSTFDLARVTPASPPQAPSAVPVQASTTTAEPVVQQAPASVADAFSSFATPSATSASATASTAGAVDITAIEPRRELALPQEPEAAPQPPANPRRFWVQIATGRDRSALRFDWRRFSRSAPEILGDRGPFVARWNATNRLLAGPFANARAARDAVSELKEEGVDSFTFTSAEGEEVEELR